MGLCLQHASKRRIRVIRGAAVLEEIPRSPAFALLLTCTASLLQDMDNYSTIVAASKISSCRNTKSLRTKSHAGLSGIWSMEPAWLELLALQPSITCPISNKHTKLRRDPPRAAAGESKSSKFLTSQRTSRSAAAGESRVKAALAHSVATAQPSQKTLEPEAVAAMRRCSVPM